MIDEEINDQKDYEELAGKPILEVLEHFPTDTRFYIGGKTNYMIIGDFFYIKEHCDERYEEYRKCVAKQLECYQKWLENNIDADSKFDVSVSVKYRYCKDDLESIYGQIELAETKLRNLKNKLSAMESEKEYLAEYTPPFERVASRVYDKLDGGIAIILEGTETGDYWFEEEQEVRLGGYRRV